MHQIPWEPITCLGCRVPVPQVAELQQAFPASVTAPKEDSKPLEAWGLPLLHLSRATKDVSHDGSISLTAPPNSIIKPAPLAGPPQWD